MIKASDNLCNNPFLRSTNSSLNSVLTRQKLSEEVSLKNKLKIWKSDGDRKKNYISLELQMNTQ